MSRPVYKGFRLATDSLAEALRIVESFRPWVANEAEKMLDTFMDHVTADGTDVVRAYDRWQDLRTLIRNKRQRVGHVDTDFSVVLIPAQGGMLGIVYTEHSAWLNAWLALPGVEEFGYWDSGADEKSETEDWAARGKAWEILTDDPVSMQGFCIEVVSPEGPRPRHWRNLKK